jgi:predicted MFS family arabinose efflux permease
VTGLALDRRVVPAGVAIIGVTYGLARYAYGLFVPEIRADFELGTTALGAIASGSYAAYLVATVLSGTAAERVGPRRLVALGGSASVAGMAAVAVAPTTAVLAAAVVVAGSGSGFVWPALSDALARLLPAAERRRALALTNSGTCYAVALAGPLALAAGGRWRAAWVAFAVLGIAATLWSAGSLPRGRLGEPGTAPPLRLGWLVSRESAPLLALACAFGATSAVYWTFAVDLIVGERGADPSSATGRIFLTVVGVAGVVGGVAGALVDRIGLGRTISAAVLAAALAIALLPAAATTWAGIVPSALLFGSSFIVVAGTAAIWSVQIYGDRPAAGVAAMTFAFTIGSMLGPAGLGAVGEAAGLATAFYVAAALTGFAALAAVRAPQ